MPARASGAYKDVRITYKTNAQGWRSREIVPSSPNKKVMFVGCSFTMGIGLPYEDVWTSVATRHLEAVLVRASGAAQFRLRCPWKRFLRDGRASGLADPEARSPRRAVLRPVTTNRFPEIRPPDGVAADYVPDENRRSIQAFLELQSDSEDFMDFVRQHSFIDAVAKLNRTPWVWQSKQRPSCIAAAAQVAKYVRTDNMIDSALSLTWADAKDETLKRDFARDGMHPGPVANKTFGVAAARVHPWPRILAQRKSHDDSSPASPPLHVASTSAGNFRRKVKRLQKRDPFIY